MLGLFTKEQALKIINDYRGLVGHENYVDPYPTLKVGFLQTVEHSDGSSDINIGVSPFQLEIPEFMGFTEHWRPLLIFLKIKGIQFDAEKYGI